MNKNETVANVSPKPIHNQTVVDVQPSVSRARGVGKWGPYAEWLIEQELVACTLGARVRPELMVNTL